MSGNRASAIRHRPRNGFLWLVLGGTLVLGGPILERPIGPGGGAASAQSMRAKIYDKLSKAEALADEGKIEEALKKLSDVEGMSGLNSYEKAQLYTAYGFIYFNQSDYAKSIASYEKVLLQENLPEGMETGTLYTLAQLLFQNEEYERSIDSLNRWLAATPDPAPDPYILLGQAYYQLERHREAIEPVRKAIEIAKNKGRQIQENWYLLLRVFYYELEEYEQALDTLKILVREHPKRQYWLHLAALYGELDRERERLHVYEIAYLQGFLERGDEIRLLAQLLLEADVPYRAGVVLQQGLGDGLVEKSAENYRLLSQAWTLAHEDHRAIEALKAAAALSDDGELAARLAHVYLNIDEWSEAATAARAALQKGVHDEDQIQLLLGMALFELERYDEAKSAFRGAMSSPDSRNAALQWINYIDKEQERLLELRRSLGR
jgi:tetratricopeptide (TPR) repeat protein